MIFLSMIANLNISALDCDIIVVYLVTVTAIGVLSVCQQKLTGEVYNPASFHFRLEGTVLMDADTTTSLWGRGPQEREMTLQ